MVIKLVIAVSTTMYVNNMKACKYWHADPLTHFDGLMQKRHNSIANAQELSLSCTNPSIC